MKGSSKFEFPPDLEVYLPPSLWRNLSSGEPQRILLVQALDRLRSISRNIRIELSPQSDGKRHKAIGKQVTAIIAG